MKNNIDLPGMLMAVAMVFALITISESIQDLTEEVKRINLKQTSTHQTIEEYDLANNK